MNVTRTTGSASRERSRLLTLAYEARGLRRHTKGRRSGRLALKLFATLIESAPPTYLTMQFGTSEWSLR